MSFLRLLSAPSPRSSVPVCAAQASGPPLCIQSITPVTIESNERTSSQLAHHVSKSAAKTLLTMHRHTADGTMYKRVCSKPELESAKKTSCPLARQHAVGESMWDGSSDASLGARTGHGVWCGPPALSDPQRGHQRHEARGRYQAASAAAWGRNLRVLVLARARRRKEQRVRLDVTGG